MVGNIGNNSEEQFLLGIIRDLAERLRQKCNYKESDIIDIISSEETVPVAVFSNKLAPSEALTKYLKEDLDKNYHEISEITKRDERGVWLNYQRALQKMKGRFNAIEGMRVPVSIFSERRLSVFESLVVHLKENKKMKNAKIAALISKDNANIWTVYNRAVKKLK